MALVLGLLVTGMVLSMYLSGVVGHRQAAALARMTADAHMALDTLVRDLRMAGHVEGTGISAATGALPAGLARPVTVARPVFGCDTGFADPRADFGQSSCGTAGTPAVEVSFEVTLDTAPPTATTDPATGAPIPADCLGHTVDAFPVAGSPAAPRLVSHRYFIDASSGAAPRRALYCASTGKRGVQPLVEGVEAIRLRYGVAPGWAADRQDTRRPQRYVRAVDVADWAEVVAVRICVLMRSTEPVFVRGEVAPYVDCDGIRRPPEDLHLYQAFHATATLRNRAGWG